MLIQLNLKNIALIEIIEINFEKGLNIITGDSGSGKSLILDSLNVLFGGTNIPLKHLIRPGKQDCLIEAKFSSSIEIDDWLSFAEWRPGYWIPAVCERWRRFCDQYCPLRRLRSRRPVSGIDHRACRVR